MAITHLDTQKDSLCTQLHDFILAVGWSDGSSNLDYAEKFDLPFSIPRLWLQHGITGVLRGLRVISDQMFRPVIYDLAALQAYQNHGIGKTVLKRRMVYFLIECLAKREQSWDTGENDFPGNFTPLSAILRAFRRMYAVQDGLFRAL